MTSPATLPTGNKLELAKYLSYQDLSSFCQLDKSNAALCRDETFWRELYKLRNQGEEPRMRIRNLKDFVFLEDLIRKTQVTPLETYTKTITFRNPKNTRQKENFYQRALEKYPEAIKIINYLQEKEIQAYLSGAKPIYYGFYGKPLLDDPFNNYNQLIDTTIKAYSSEGAVLKYTRLYKGQAIEGAEYFAYLIVHQYYPFADDANTTTEIIDVLKDEKGQDYEPSEEEIFSKRIDLYVNSKVGEEVDYYPDEIYIIPAYSPPRVY